MTDPGIVLRSLATANPPLYVTQHDAFTHYDRLFDLAADERDLYRRLLMEGSVRGRFIAMDSPDEAVEADADRLNERYLKFARMIGAQAVRESLTRAGVLPADVGGLVVNSCTGYLCPGLTSYLAEDVGLPTSMRIADLMGMGCGGALPNLSVAMGMLAADPDKPVVSVAVEICTATLFMGTDPGLIVSNSIFGDGASAAVLARCAPATGADPGPDGLAVQILDYESGLFPKHRAQLQYRTEDHRLRNVLGSRVPAIGAWAIHEVAGRLLRRNGLAQSDISHWAVHPGGTAVLRSVARTFGLSGDELRHSYHVFEHFGNMSSPSVMFVLQRLLAAESPEPGDYGLLLSFGAGFSAYAVLVQF